MFTKEELIEIRNLIDGSKDKLTDDTSRVRNSIASKIFSKLHGHLQEGVISNVWHDAGDTPEEGSRICLLGHLTSGMPTMVSMTYSSMDARAAIMLEAEKWAYIDDLLNFTIQEEPVSEDLERASRKYEETRSDSDAVSDNQVVRRAFKAGAQWQKQQMMKDAIETSVATAFIIGLHIEVKLDPSKFRFGDKVKLIIIKEE